MAVNRCSKASCDIETRATEEEYPAGLKPLPIQAERHDLGSDLSWSSADDHTVSIIIKKGVSRREAMRFVHRQCLQTIKKIVMEDLEEAKQMAVETSTKEKFFEAAKVAIMDAIIESQGDESIAPELEELRPKKRKLQEDAVNAILEEEYEAVVKQVTADHKKAIGKKKKQKEKEDKKRAEEDKESDVEENFAAIVEKVVDKRVSERIREEALRTDFAEEDDMEGKVKEELDLDVQIQEPTFGGLVDAIYTKKCKASNIKKKKETTRREPSAAAKRR